ncbi:hypothetical protein PC120_g11674 [Phytophthora cactorum]|nr:hypothetical protein PC120_g11674 [Phytophthora cactorum]
MRVSGGGSVMVWALMSAHGKTDIAILEGRQDSACYTHTLDNYLAPFIENLRENHGICNPIFKQDNASIHESRFTKAHIEIMGIKKLKWPAKSPDLNPTENAQIIRSWKDIKQSYLRDLVNTMPTRMAQVVLKNGGPIDNKPDSSGNHKAKVRLAREADEDGEESEAEESPSPKPQKKRRVVVKKTTAPVKQAKTDARQESTEPRTKAKARNDAYLAIRLPRPRDETIPRRTAPRGVDAVTKENVPPRKESATATVLAVRIRLDEELEEWDSDRARRYVTLVRPTMAALRYKRPETRECGQQRPRAEEGDDEGEDGGTIDDEVASEEDEDPEMTKVEVDGEMVRLDDELDVDTVIDLGSVAKVRAATKVTDQGSREENEGQTSRKTEKSSHIRRSGRDGSHTGR